MLLLGTLVMVLSACADNLPRSTLNPVGENAQTIDDLFRLTLWIAAVFFVGVNFAVLYVAIRYRARKGDEREPKQVHGNDALEITWTVIPALILAVIAVPTVRTIFELADEPENALQVEVIGHQWWWEYRYPDLGVVTANEMWIPTNQPVFLSMTTDDQDVIHSFWIPNLNGKRDVVPGRVNTLSLSAPEPGVYLGQCAEYCGLSHARMRMSVTAVTPAEFDAWVAEQRAPAEVDLDGDGWGLFLDKGCSACHAIGGTDALGGGLNPGPDLTHVASRSTFAGGSYELNTENLRAWLRNPSALKPMEPDVNIGMPNLGLSEDEIDTLVAFLEELK